MVKCLITNQESGVRLPVCVVCNKLLSPLCAHSLTVKCLVSNHESGVRLPVRAFHVTQQHMRTLDRGLMCAFFAFAYVNQLTFAVTMLSVSNFEKVRAREAPFVLKIRDSVEHAFNEVLVMWARYGIDPEFEIPVYFENLLDCQFTIDSPTQLHVFPMDTDHWCTPKYTALTDYITKTCITAGYEMEISNPGSSSNFINIIVPLVLDYESDAE